MPYFLNTWAVGIMEFTSGQYGEIQNIACLTTLEGGPAVADARLLLGLSDMDDFECGLRIGATKDEKKNSIHLYPNPASDAVTVVSEIDFNEIILLDVSGRIIDKYFFTNNEVNVNISVKDLTKGVYYLKISNALELQIQKLIVN